MRWATRRGCSTKFVVELIDAGNEDLVVGNLDFFEVFPFVIVPRVGGLDRERLRVRLEGERQDFLKRQVEAVRAFVVAPADVQAHAVGGQPFGRGIERGDVAFGDVFQKLVVAEMPVLVVARRTEVGGVDLQHKARFHDRFVFMPHHVGERADISLLVRVVEVDDEARENARRRRRHEDLGGLRLRGGRLELRDVAIERAAVEVAQFADAAGKRHVAETSITAGEIRMRQQIAAQHDVAAALGGARVGRDAADAVADIGGVGRLAHLAVADHVDAGGDLFGDHRVDRVRALGLERRRIDGFAVFALAE